MAILVTKMNGMLFKELIPTTLTSDLTLPDSMSILQLNLSKLATKLKNTGLLINGKRKMITESQLPTKS